ncbi:50S ribosomal protein L33 [Marinilactibacillus psychrotolerans]|uniref:Large ribosomal subunit protein bL33 n=3 Tax=Marinilactibacillus psychrotolerans TaxID=191770 RepID=A0AAV3WYC8_9LACT|nr:50S ribosomal protein L33 [Marinilactibacillus psychrotolerans]GEQ34052.1 50S ribosomal protein L33 [Marinilactibacillus psychrotolerans]GEQ35864.1 50S ribosomal protein L33 [Marinilactibacillus psychrotolerans]SJN17108.1 LSU ribosomal protein L33p @ LSU ribosomal protein L33p, zinc-dependent [Marinilactibacillus psychrotolerans 42ea]
MIGGNKKRGTKLMKKKMILACTDCGSRNYSKDGGAKVRTERLEVKKYCSYCGKHTIHRETK